MVILGNVIKRVIKTRAQINFRHHSAVAYQERTLRKLLRKARHTEFGMHYGFGSVLESENLFQEYKRRIPIHNYNSIYNQWWNKTHNGISNVCWPGVTKYFALSSGTSESASKHIPITRDMIRSIRRASLKQILSLANYDFPSAIFQKGILMLGGSTHLQNKGDFFEGDLSGISAKKIPFWFKQQFYKPGRKIAKEKNWEKKLNEIARKAPQWDIAIVCGIPAWVQIMLEKVVEQNNVKSIHEIWPNFSCYVTGGVAFEPYRKGLEKLFSKPVTCVDTYLASEGFVAFQDNPHTSSMKMIMNNGIYFEFVPFDEKNFDANGELIKNPNAINISEVEEEKPYALLLSTCAGAWRYLIGDVIKFTSVEKSEIQIVGRTKHFLSLCGEHLSIENMNHAIEKAEEDFNISVKEFSVAGIPHNGMFAHQWFIGTDDKIDEKNFANKIDEYLKVLNDDYATERTAALKDVLVKILPTEIFYKWFEQKNKLGGQNKFPRVMKGKQLEEWLQFISEQKI